MTELAAIRAMKVAELKAELDKRNLSKTGTKALLVERLHQVTF